MSMTGITLEELIALLQGSLSSIPGHREQCEAKLTQLLCVPGFGIQLCELMFNSPSNPPETTISAERHLAALLLKKLVQNHWVQTPNNYEEEEEEEDDDDDDNESSNLVAQGQAIAGGLAVVTSSGVTTSSSTKNTTLYVVSMEEKKQIKQILLEIVQGNLHLFTENRTFQTAFCLIMVNIFEKDWPDQWTELFPILMEIISNPTVTIGTNFAIRFLAMACEHFTSEHFCELSRVLFPHLERLFKTSSTNQCPPGIRARIVSIVQTSLVMVGIEAQSGNEQAKIFLHTNISPWIQMFMHDLMTTPIGLDIKEYAVKIQILSSLSAFVIEWPKNMSDLLPHLLPQIYLLLSNGLETFQSQVIYATSTNEEQEEQEEYDSDHEGTQIGRLPLILQCLEFIRATIQTPTKKTRQLVLTCLPQFIYVMIGYMQISTNQMKTWHETPNQYVADEDDDSLSYTIRNGMIDLLCELEIVLGEKALIAILPAAQKRIETSSIHSRTSSINHYSTYSPGSSEVKEPWRLQEAALLVIGTLAPQIVATTCTSTSTTRTSSINNLIDFPSFFDILFALIHAKDQVIYLRARALWCASRLAKHMKEEQLHAFFQVALSGLETNQLLPIRMYACRAVGCFLLYTEQNKQNIGIQQCMHQVIERLEHLTEVCTFETMHIALETMVIVIKAAVQIEPKTCEKVITCFLKQWRVKMNDPIIYELFEQVLGFILIAGNHQTVLKTHELVLPVVITLFSQNKSKRQLQQDGRIVVHASNALGVLNILLRHSFLTKTSDGKNYQPICLPKDLQQELAWTLVHVVFEPLVDLMYSSMDDSDHDDHDDHDDHEQVFNRGAECLKWFVMFALDTLCQYKCQNTWCPGLSGIECTMQMAAKLLSPTVSDSSAIYVGGLMTQILLQLGPSLSIETIESILNAISLRLANAEMLSLTQSLCMVFAHLVHTHDRGILDVLERLPSPQLTPLTSGVLLSPSTRTRRTSYKNMLEFVFATWIEKQSDFYGLYCLRVTTSALLKISQWNDPRINELVVLGNVIIEEKDEHTNISGVRTRSQRKKSSAKKKQYTQVHFPTKLLTVLAKTMKNLYDDEEEEDEWISSGEEESEEDLDEESREKVSSNTIFASTDDFELLSDRLDDICEEDGPSEEFESHFDPLNQLDLKMILPAALQHFTQNQALIHAINPELSNTERELLSNLLLR